MHIILGVEVTNAREFKGLGIRWAKLKKETLQEVALHWHATQLDRHFTPGNITRYQMKRRKPFYVEQIKKKLGLGQGKWVDLLLRGQSQRWMRVFRTVSGTSNVATLRMRPPGYFGNPFVGTFQDKRGKIRTISQQPDKPAEVTRLSDPDREDLRKFMATRLRERVKQVLFERKG